MKKNVLSILLSTCFLNFTHANVETTYNSIKNSPKELYSFLEGMPKGGELHYHLAGGASPELMIHLAKNAAYCFNTTTDTIYKDKCDGPSLKKLKLGSKLYNKILKAWSLKDFKKDSEQETKHDHFFASFFKFYPVIADYSSELLASVIKNAARQNEQYLEIMILPDDAKSSSFANLIKNTNEMAAKKDILLNNKEFQDNIKHSVAKSSAILQQTKKKLGCTKNKDANACNVAVKFQYIILREQSIDNIFAQALNGFATVDKSDDFVAINLVQAEDGPISLSNYHQQMQIINFLHQQYPRVHISLHAGELVADKVGTNQVDSLDLRYHIGDAIFTGNAERIGHGVDIANEDNFEKIIEFMAKKSIAVEINLISNKKLLNIFAGNHPLEIYLKNQVPVVLSTDDEGILRTDLTEQYVEAITQYNLDYPTIKHINRNALTYSFLPGKSIWTDAQNNIINSKCLELSSFSCKDFIQKNPKAKLQWQLEKKLLEFEKN